MRINRKEIEINAGLDFGQFAFGIGVNRLLIHAEHKFCFSFDFAFLNVWIYFWRNN